MKLTCHLTCCILHDQHNLTIAVDASYMFFLYFSGPTSRQVISDTTGPIFIKFPGLVEAWKGFIKCWFILQPLKGHCYGNQFCGQICNSPNPHLFFALAFQNKLEYHNADRRINSGDNPVTSCKNLVTFGPVAYVPVLGENWLTPPSFVILAFQNRSENCNGNRHVNSGDDHSTPDRNLVRFRPVILEFVTLKCLQHVSISISKRVSLTMFTKE